VVEIEPGPDKDGPWLSAGLVDLQVNGFQGFDVNDEGLIPEDVEALVDAELREGVTTFLPTVITASEKRIVAALKTIQLARGRYKRVADAIPFVHVEGPHLSEQDGPRGAHPAADIRAPSLEEFAQWQAASDGLVGLVTLSPHYAGSAAFIAGLVVQGVRVAIGHTHATPSQIAAAVDAGATLSTHLGNGAHGNLPRHPNYIWTQLADDRLAATFIADGHHLTADVFKAMVRAKSVDRSILISDSVGFAGMPPAIYTRRDGAQVELLPDGAIRLSGTSYLAGASFSLNEIVAIATELGGLSLADSLRMATENPGRIVGGQRQIARGAPADLILFDFSPGDRRLSIRSVIARGRRIQ
jgi:N-acetylglucosamine-6-phosphate deacetylase